MLSQEQTVNINMQKESQSENMSNLRSTLSELTHIQRFAEDISLWNT